MQIRVCTGNAGKRKVNLAALSTFITFARVITLSFAGSLNASAALSAVGSINHICPT